jgi:hypothetical protein
MAPARQPKKLRPALSPTEIFIKAQDVPSYQQATQLNIMMNCLKEVCYFFLMCAYSPFHKKLNKHMADGLYTPFKHCTTHICKEENTKLTGLNICTVFAAAPVTSLCCV